nr:putative reverse transcriptase domain-containing protein [Tanacetum cinerariifolium]
MIEVTNAKVAVAKEKLKEARTRQKSSADKHRRTLEFQPGDHVFLKVSPARRVRRFSIKGKLSPLFIGPFEILDRVGEVSYRLALPPQLSHVHDVFHVSLLRGYKYHPLHVGERVIERPKMIEVTNEKVFVAKEKLKEARTRQKSYADKHRRSLEFQPEYPEYLVPYDDEVPIKDQPLQADASPTALLLDYVADSDPSKEDPKEDPEEDPAEYPTDGDDDDDDDEEEKEKEEHLAQADSTALPAIDPVPSAKDTEAFETDESAPTPPSPRLRRAGISVRLPPPMAASMKVCIAEYAAAPTPPSPLTPLPQIPSPSLPLPSPPQPLPALSSHLLLPSTDHKYPEYLVPYDDEGKLCDAPVLALLDGPKDFVAYCDASGLGLRWLLMQRGIAMDFVTKLPRTSSGHDTIWVIVDRLTKSTYFLPMREDYKMDRKCRSSIMWAEIGEGQLIGPELVQETTEKILQIKDRLKATCNNQKSYTDKRRKPLEFHVGDHVLLKVSPWKGVVCLGKKGKLVPRFIRPFDIVEKVGSIAYRLRLLEDLNGIHDTFHVLNLKKCLADPTLQVPLNEIQVDAKLNFVEEHV